MRVDISRLQALVKTSTLATRERKSSGNQEFSISKDTVSLVLLSSNQTKRAFVLLFLSFSFSLFFDFFSFLGMVSASRHCSQY